MSTTLYAGAKLVNSGSDTTPALIQSMPVDFKEKLFKINSGFVSYNFNYRSTSDTPYFQQDIAQHSLTGNIDFSVMGIPVKLWVLGRKSNSAYFRDIYDARLEFNPRAFKDAIFAGYRKEMINKLDHLKDSLSEKYLTNKNLQLNNLKAWLNSPLNLQRLVETNEILKIPSVTYDVSLPDSLARKRSDSLRMQAKAFVELYNSKKHLLEELSAKADSLKTEYYSLFNKVNRLRNMLKGNFNNWQELQQFKKDATELAGDQMQVPAKYQWLMGVKNFSVGKAPVSYSELTAKNISVNGLNFEYNSWYYFAVSAGLIDYRFRDFTVQRFKFSSQYLLMLRAGLGDLQKNYIIVSVLKGQKQLYRSGQEQGPVLLPVTSISVEAKYQLSRYASLAGEVSQSQSVSLQSIPVTKSKFWDFSDKTNKGVAARFNFYLPRTASRVEAMYKYTGANYQSFNSFQSGSGLYSWSLKAEQQFFKKHLRIVASAKSNEFFSPYIVQTYKSNTVFKTIQASFRQKKWPTVSVGYLPVSQLTKIDNQLYENRFQTFTASANHIYKLGIQHASTFVYTRFYSRQEDTAYIFFDATNLVFTHNIFFNDFTATIALAKTRNKNYLLNVIEGAFDIPVNKTTSIGIGSKLNNFNRQQAAVGYSARLNMRFAGSDLLFVQFEKGYLPGREDALIRNDLLNAGLIKHFK